MNQITFFYTISNFDFIASVLGIALGIAACIQCLRKKQIYWEFFMAFGIILTISCSIPLFQYLVQDFNIFKKPFITLTKDSVVLHKNGSDETTEISWKNIKSICREDYTVRSNVGKRREKHYQNLVFHYQCLDNGENPKNAHIDLRYLNESDFTLFSQIRKFYSDQILKEFEKGKFKILVGTTADELLWRNYPNLAEEKISLLIVEFNSGRIVKSIGDCHIQESPCSTFKIALSLMGFDSDILKDEGNPEWPTDEYRTQFEDYRQPNTPKTWIKNSCVWYSQKLTSILAMDKFRSYVKKFDYGNQDVSGNAGKDDGISKSWLCSSLKISPQQQVDFIKKLLTNSLPVSKYAHEQTRKILFNTDLGDGWKLYAKTGGGIIENTSRAWLVGWAAHEVQNKTYIFASLVRSNDNNLPTDLAVAKQNVLDELSTLRGLNDKQRNGI